MKKKERALAEKREERNSWRFEERSGVLRASQVALVVKNPSTNAGDLGLIPGLRQFPDEGNGNSLQYSCLENPMDRGAWSATVHGVAKSRTRLSD